MTTMGAIEREVLSSGLYPVGIDEVGKGCIAGPVYAACVELDYHRLATLPKEELKLIRDSKTLSQKQRQRILGTLEDCALNYKVAAASAREIERYGIASATFLAMKRAFAKIVGPKSIILIDGNQPIPRYEGRQRSIVKGDSLCYAIAAASIFAKETRDRYMRQQSDSFPQYGFDSHVGYGTKRHLESLDQHGICDLHRRNFAPVRKHVEQSSLQEASKPHRSPSSASGDAAELSAAEYLTGNLDYLLLCRNYRGIGFEIDMICQDHHTLVAVEVKSTRGHLGDLTQVEKMSNWHQKKRKLKIGLSKFWQVNQLREVKTLRIDVILMSKRKGREHCVHAHYIGI